MTKVKLNPKSKWFLVIVSLLILFCAVFFRNEIKYSADSIGASCFPGAYYQKETNQGSFTGIDTLVLIGQVVPDPNRYQAVTYPNHPGITFCKAQDNPSIYFGIKDVNGQETDIGLSWDLGQDGGQISHSQIVFRPFWRVGNNFNQSPLGAQWNSGETVEMKLTIPKDGYLDFSVEGGGKSFDSGLFQANIHKNGNHEIKFVTSIDQMNNENKPVQPTNATFNATQWLFKKVFIGGATQSVNIPSSNASNQFCPGSSNVNSISTNSIFGGETVNIFGNSYNSSLVTNTSCNTPAPIPAGSGAKTIIITAP